MAMTSPLSRTCNQCTRSSKKPEKTLKRHNKNMQPTERSFCDFSKRSPNKKTVKGSEELTTFNKTSSFNYDGHASLLSAGLSSTSSSYANTRNTILNQTVSENIPCNELSYTFDAEQHRKILQMLASDIKETTWTCRHCANSALHVNICASCKSSRSLLLLQHSKSRSLDEQVPTTSENVHSGNFQQSQGDDTPVEDQSWTCKTCTLINNSNSLTCEACCASKLKSLSISDDITSQKDKFWSCPLCSFENSSPVCAGCKTRSINLKHPKNNKKIESSTVKSNCKQIKASGKKKQQNCAVSGTALKVDISKGDSNSTINLPGQFKSWRCSICTFEKSRSELICDMCKNMRNDTNQPTQLSQEKILELQWHYIVGNCQIENKLYVDETFPAVPSSLYYSPAENKDEAVKWVRMRNVTVYRIDADLPWVVFRTLLKPTDVCQGELGDCWFISALSVLVERQDLVRAVIITKYLCSQGVYQVRLCKDGNWTVVTVDDLFPCDEDGVLLYSQAIRKQLWVPLIEKAFAKMHGCFEALTTGSISEGLATLTGAPCENIPLQSFSPSDIIDADLIWAQLESSRQARFLMGTSCGDINMNIEEAEFEKKGLHSCHVYSILDVRCISGYRILQLRDPYGEFGLDNSFCWIPHLQTKLFVTPENGVFWIDFPNVLKYFTSIGICKIRSGWNEIRMSGVLSCSASQQELSCVSLTVHEPTEIDLILHQNSQREIEKSKRTQNDLCVVLLKAKGDLSYGYSHVTNSKRKIQEFVGCCKILEPAEYIIIPLTFNHWHLEVAAESDPRYVLAIHSSKRVSTKQVTSSPQALADTVISLAVIHGECQELLEHFTVYYLSKNFSGAAIVAENKYTNKWIHLKCEGAKESYNVVSTRGLKNTVDSIPPLHRQVVAVFTQLKANNKFFTAHQLDYRVSDAAELGDWGSRDMSHIPEIDYETDGLHLPRLIQNS